MFFCKNCASTNIKIVETTDEYKILKCADCLFYYKEGNEVNYEALKEEDYSCYNFDRKREVKELNLIIKKHCKRTRVNILEIGSGTSAISNELYRLGYNVICVEPNKVAVKISNRTFPHITVINDYFNSKLVTNDIDVILLYDVMEHLEPSNKVFDEICNFMGRDTFLVLKSGNPLALNAQMFFSRWIYLLVEQHISFYSSTALKVFCKNRNLDLINYYEFRHAYGGIAIGKILKNILKIILKSLQVDTLIGRNFSIELANDHFIAVIKKKAIGEPRRNAS